MNQNSTLNILLLCDLPRYSTNANTLFEHVYGLKTLSRHNIWVYRRRGNIPSWIDLDSFDVLVIHYSHFILGSNYLSEQAKKRITAFNGVKAIFIQDEYRFVRPIGQEIKKLGINIIFTCISAPENLLLYPVNVVGNVRLVTVLTGYAPLPSDDDEDTPKIDNRPMHITYRGRKLPYWYGSVAQEKWEIVPKFLDRMASHASCSHWVHDLSYSEEDRIYGDQWLAFLKSSKAVLGVESAASVVDFEGTLAAKVESFQEMNPHATYMEAEEKFFPGMDKKIYLRCISPRCFEAAKCGAAMILLEGEYSNILVPWKHYVPLKKDYSNFDEVVDVINDTQKLQQIADNAYRDLIKSKKYSYDLLASAFDDAIEAEMTNLGLIGKHAKISALTFNIISVLGNKLDELTGAIKKIYGVYKAEGLSKTISFVFFRSLRRIALANEREIKPFYKQLKNMPIIGPLLRCLRDKALLD